MRPTVVLFDVDGTLVSCGGAGRKALTAAFRELYAKGDVLHFNFGGLTDRSIVRRGLRTVGAADDEAGIDRVIERYLVHLPELVRASESYRVLPGVIELLESLGSERSYAVGLGTGNVQAGARAKLSRGKLWDYFGFGGFGCDHEDRAQLLAVGARRGAERLQTELAGCRVLIVGDTPRDVVAAHAIGAECLAVATGDHSEAELAESGADYVLGSLSLPDAERVLFRR